VDAVVAARWHSERLAHIDPDGLRDQALVVSARHHNLINIRGHFLWFGLVWFGLVWFGLVRWELSYTFNLKSISIFFKVLQGCRCVLYFTSDWIM
jgi:hypothetical protein